MTFEELCGDQLNQVELYTVGTGPKRFIKIALTRKGHEPVYIGRGKTVQLAVDNLWNQL